MFIDQLDVASADLSGLQFGAPGGGLPVGVAGGHVYRFRVAPSPSEVVSILAGGATAAVVERLARGRAQPAGAAAAGGVGGIAPMAAPVPLPRHARRLRRLRPRAGPGLAARRALDKLGQGRVVGQEVALPPAKLDFGGRSVVMVASEFCAATRLGAGTDIDAWARERRALLQRGEPRLLAWARGAAASSFLAHSRLMICDARVQILLKGPDTIGDAVVGLQARSPGGFMASHERWPQCADSYQTTTSRVVGLCLALCIPTAGTPDRMRKKQRPKHKLLEVRSDFWIGAGFPSPARLLRSTGCARGAARGTQLRFTESACSSERLRSCRVLCL
ncbi:unnamed protein product [Prorocentrum cordatum]|uniref:Uncharacterized protein n=1 Tax=Prorocentrum cordatum TaxID=2364126 RepID=A0ABN9WW88_9DINO|nr:unnamed protein product [Polarella glacialis]